MGVVSIHKMVPMLNLSSKVRVTFGTSCCMYRKAAAVQVMRDTIQQAVQLAYSFIVCLQDRGILIFNITPVCDLKTY